ncbi:hypothetical protein HRbin04_00435 [archaeon HR04]|uniref:VapB-type antitoxin n=1 Tax=uncultured crenarchaeote TaxID=29281 RepID=H5SVV8_9CREN|nr:hypothetical protein HGMM_F45C05C09 [uncultured crenarchaeote]GBC73039.1 hypothetical protein HRbin04_00435 [archaeon HR04]
MDAVVTFRVDKRLKARMDRLKHINWSEMLRRYVEEVVEKEERELSSRKRRRRDVSLLKRAAEEMDRLAKLSAGAEWIGEEEVRRWRRRRFSL